jgi:hypothetical protein
MLPGSRLIASSIMAKPWIVCRVGKKRENMEKNDSAF